MPERTTGQRTGSEADLQGLHRALQGSPYRNQPMVLLMKHGIGVYRSTPDLLEPNEEF